MKRSWNCSTMPADTTSDNHQLVGVPTSVDTDPGALEVFLRPVGAEDVEIAVSLTDIRAVVVA
jgi:hypothetical protein